MRGVQNVFYKQAKEQIWSFQNLIGSFTGVTLQQMLNGAKTMNKRVRRGRWQVLMPHNLTKNGAKIAKHFVTVWQLSRFKGGSMNKQSIAQQIVDIQTMLEVAKDNVIEEHNEDARVILQRVVREIKQIHWRMKPVNQ